MSRNAREMPLSETKIVSPSRSLTRFLGLVEVLAERRDAMRLSELSRALSSPKSSLLLLLQPMVAQGYLTRGPEGYRLGPVIFRLASDILSARDFSRLVRPYLEELVARGQESVFLATIDRKLQLVSYIEAIESPQPVRYSVPAGSTRPLYCSAAGRVLLAFQSDDWRERYLRKVKIKPMTEKTVTNISVLKKELDNIRRAGVAISIGEAIPGAAGIAAPIHAADGSVDSALLIAAPINRFERELPALRKLLEEVAARASGELGPSISRK